jgi:hypothetical protein
MPPKKRHVREPPAEDPSQMAGGQDHTTIKATILTANIPQTSDPHTSTESHTATIDVRRPEGPTKQPSTQTEVVTTDVATLNPPPSSWQQRQPRTKPHTERRKPKRTTSKILRTKLKPSSKMSWRAFAKKMNAFS